MLARDLLAVKGAAVETIGPEESISEALRIIYEKRIGSLVVVEDEKLLGIISERDILSDCFQQGVYVGDKKVRELMTKNLIIGLTSDPLDYIMGVMTENRIRHLPIMEDGRLAGIVSIGDVVKYSLEKVKIENRYLRDYIMGY